MTPFPKCAMKHSSFGVLEVTL